MRKRKLPFTDVGHTLTIEGTCLSEDGRYATHGLLPGERALIVPLKKKKGQWICQSQNIEQDHPARVIPVCAHAAQCGGCSYQHFDRPAQLAFKREWLQTLFDQCEPKIWLETLSGKDVGYRSKARLGVKHVAKKGRTLIGFREVGSAYITEMTSCQVLVPELAELIEPLSRLIDGLDSRSSIPQIEVAASNGSVALVVRHLTILSASDLAAFADFQSAHQVMVLLQSKGPDSVRPLTENADPLLHYRLNDQGLVFEFHPMDFTQVNQAVNQEMVNRALDLLDLKPGDQVLDAFCGIGNFSLAIAQAAAGVIGLEASTASVDRARKNAQLNGLKNASFDVADLYSTENSSLVLPQINKVLLDPPRSGAELVCNKLVEIACEKIVYVSCNPKTLRRDADILIAGGYQLDQMGMIDMFPHTAHMESIALFSRGASNG
jgi:23S rRNA (uracil1939-C5)-methyltransferase